MRTKAELRDLIRAKRRELSEPWIVERSARAQSRLLAIPEFAAARSVATYLAFGGEVLTDALLAHCREAGCMLYVPAYDPVSGIYRLCGLAERELLVAGRWGILEPSVPCWIGKETPVDCLVVPGVAFDIGGGRVGHGCGYYDRMTREPCVAGAWKAGLAFDFQVFDRVPMAAHDVPMDLVVTESRVLKRGGK